jgi:hypothetical protein
MSRTGVEVNQVAIESRTCINGDRPRIALGIVSSIFQGSPSTFQEDPMLGIKQFGFAGGIAKEGGIELIKVRHAGVGVDIMRRIWV